MSRSTAYTCAWEAALSGERVERRLAAIVAADVIGYIRQRGPDATGALERRSGELIDPSIAEHKGIVKTAGHGIIMDARNAAV
jgi:adenylate cyclase